MDMVTLAAAKGYTEEYIEDIINSGGTLTKVSWEDVKDKPFEEISEGQIIAWDGNVNGLPVIEKDVDVGDGIIIQFNLYKVSDTIITQKRANGCNFGLYTPEGEVEMTTDFIKNSGNGIFYTTSKDMKAPLIFVCSQAGNTMDINIDGIELSFTFPETGVWFAAQLQKGQLIMRVASFEIPAEIKTLDSKYLPNGCAGREIGTKILWDGVPTDTYMQPGWVIEWDGSDTGVSCPVIAGPNSEMEVPEGAAFYKVSEKLDSLVGLIFEVDGENVYLDSDSVLTYFDENDGQVIATFGSSTIPFVWNIEKPSKIMVMGNEAVFEEEGLYFLKTSNEYWVERIYNELYAFLKDTKFYKISEPINDTLDGYILNLLDEDNEEIELPFSNENENVLFGQTETGSSYVFPYIFNIKTDNEKIETYIEGITFSFNFEKAGLYSLDFSNMGATFNFLAGRDYQILKINKKFLPDDVSDKYRTYIENSDDTYPTSGAVFRALGNRSQLSIKSSLDTSSSDPVSSSAVYQGLKKINDYLYDSDYSDTNYTSLRYRGANLRPISQEYHNATMNGTITWFYE